MNNIDKFYEIIYFFEANGYDSQKVGENMSIFEGELWKIILIIKEDCLYFRTNWLIDKEKYEILNKLNNINNITNLFGYYFDNNNDINNNIVGKFIYPGFFDKKIFHTILKNLEKDNTNFLKIFLDDLK